MRTWLYYIISYLFIAAALPGCSTNPVTGKSELKLVSEEQEISIGKQKFSPYRQAQGGDYIVDPEIQNYVQKVGERLAAVSDRKLPYEFRVINDSSPNAWALPGGKIALNRGLLVELQSEAELAAVLGHEIVHAAAGHTASNIQRDLLLQGALIASSIALSDNEYKNIALTGAQLGAGMLNQKYGRDAEREADYYGMTYMSRAGYAPEKAVELQKTFVRLSKDRNQNWLTGLFASHPPSQERVENNQKTLAGLKQVNGDVGAERYQQKIARLTRNKPAYEAFDEAGEALKKKNYSSALKLVDKAIRIEPGESLFHGLRGEILSEQGNNKEARQSLDRAIALNPDYFKNYLARGFVHRDLGNKTLAVNDFEKSNSLLPTTEGQYGLGVIAMKDGRQNDAIGYFQKAANANTDVGKAASIHLARLDLPSNPGKYIKTGLTLDNNGYLQVVIQNSSKVKVSGVRVVVGRRTTFGLHEDGTFYLRKTLEPNQRISVRTDIGPVTTKTLRGYGAAVSAAKVVE